MGILGIEPGAAGWAARMPHQCGLSPPPKIEDNLVQNVLNDLKDSHDFLFLVCSGPSSWSASTTCWRSSTLRSTSWSTSASADDERRSGDVFVVRSSGTNSSLPVSISVWRSWRWLWWRHQGNMWRHQGNPLTYSLVPAWAAWVCSIWEELLPVSLPSCSRCMPFTIFSSAAWLLYYKIEKAIS